MAKEDFQIDLDRVQSVFSDELSGIDIEVARREIGNGPQFALCIYQEDTTVQLWESNWFSKDEFEIYIQGMKNLDLIFDKASTERERQHTLDVDEIPDGWTVNQSPPDDFVVALEYKEDESQTDPTSLITLRSPLEDEGWEVTAQCIHRGTIAQNTPLPLIEKHHLDSEKEGLKKVIELAQQYDPRNLDTSE